MNIRKILCAAALCALVLFAGALALADSDGYYDYDVLSDGTACITGYRGEENQLSVPATLGGHAVTGIAYEAFSDCSAVSVFLPEGLTTLEDGAFDCAFSLVYASLPSTLTTIEGQPFGWCYNLKTVDLAPNPYFTMRDNCLIENATGRLVMACEAALSTAVRIPEGVTAIGDGAFISWYDLTDISFPSTLRDIGSHAFAYNESLREIRLNEGLEFIDWRAFCNCPELAYVYLPASLESISGEVFEDCSEDIVFFVPANSYAETWCAEQGVRYLVNTSGGAGEPAEEPAGEPASQGGAGIVIPDSVIESINNGGQDETDGSQPVAGGSIWGGFGDAQQSAGEFATAPVGGGVEITGYAGSDEHVEIPDQIGGQAVVRIGQLAFSDNTTLQSVIVPLGVKEIGDMAFLSCANLTSAALPEGLRRVGHFAFAECVSLESVVLPSTLTELGNCSFLECGRLTSVTLPTSLAQIGQNPFALCKRLEDIVLQDGARACVQDEDGALYAVDGQTLIAFPAGRIDLRYAVAPGTRVIGYAAFAADPFLLEVTLNPGVEIVEDFAFLNCRSLRKMTLPEGTQSIGEQAFANDIALRALYIPQSVTSIGSQAFDGCVNLTVTTPAGSFAEEYCLQNGISVVNG